MTANTHHPSHADLRLVADYLRGLRNEIALDILAIEMAGLDPTRYGKIPRPMRWIGKVRRVAFLSRLVQYLSLPLWYFLGPMLYRRQSRALAAGHGDTPRFDAAGQILAFSSRTLDIVHPRHLDPQPRQWVELPWLPLSNLPPDAEVLRGSDLLDENDVARSLALATLAHRVLQRRRREVSGWGLQSYTAWRWFIARLIVDKLPGPLLTVEHFDRWAVLVDGSVQRTHQRQPDRRLTLMQHGSVNAEATPRGLRVRLPTRLRAVSHLHAYSAADVQVFEDQILSPRCRERGVSTTFYRPSVALVDMATAGTPSILFVGHPLCEAAHCALMEVLHQRGDCQLFYKPHPASRASGNIAKLPWTLIEGRSTFPRVDAIVSYPSTMVAEYAAHGIPAVLHRMDIPSDQILDRVPEIIRAIQSRRSPAPRATAALTHSTSPQR